MIGTLTAPQIIKSTRFYRLCIFISLATKMLFDKFITVAGLAAVGQALLLPPTITTMDNDIISTLPFEVATEVDGRVLDLDCRGCRVAVPSHMGTTSWVEAENRLRLNFSIAHEDSEKLLLNGVQVYPTSDLMIGTLTAPQIIKSTHDHDDVVKSNPRLGYEFSIRPVVSDQQDQIELIAIYLQIIEVGAFFVDGLESVELKLLKTPSGKLMIGDLGTAPTTNPTPTPGDSERECTTMICKWRVIIASKLSHLKSLKGCGGKTRPSGNLPASARPKHHGRPRPHGLHRPYRHHKKNHGLGHFMRSIVLHIFFPVVIGIFTGVTASLIGMIVGHLAIFLWRAFFRRGGKGAYAKVEQKDIVVEDGGDETKGFLDHQGPPPVYEETVVDEKAAE
jgi:hypothetical protein